jgi:hypothetical protein
MAIVANSRSGTTIEVPRAGSVPSKRTNYIGGSEEGPQAFLVHEVTAPAYIKPHFHHVRQFQVIVSDNARFGKRDVPAISFHYADPSTPYGPIFPGEEDPLAFFTLRADLSDGTYYMPGSREKMQHKAGRNIARHVEPETPAEPLTTLIELHDDGLAAYRLAIGASNEVEGVPVAGSGGQYYLVMQGEVEAEGELLPPQSLIFVAADEAPPVLKAGPNGADLLVMQFPVRLEYETH